MSTTQLKTQETVENQVSPAPNTESAKPMPGLRSVEQIEQTLSDAESALAQAQEIDRASRIDPSNRLRLKVSILMPVFNEEATLDTIIDKVRLQGVHDELVIVDDCSTDGTRDRLIELNQNHDDIRIIMHGYNKGKGAALKTALMHARGDIVLVQDADLEYDPADYAKLIEPIQNGEADVVYGSRYLEDHSRNSSGLHRFGNRMLTNLSNLTTGLRLSDMETCYKAIRRDAMRGIHLRENRFGFEPEITAKLARRGARIVERPISYHARGWDEGKKIGIRDGIRAIWCIMRYAWIS